MEGDYDTFKLRAWVTFMMGIRDMCWGDWDSSSALFARSMSFSEETGSLLF